MPVCRSGLDTSTAQCGLRLTRRWRAATDCASSLPAAAATARHRLCLMARAAARARRQQRLQRRSAAGPGGGRAGRSSARLCGTAAACSSTLAPRKRSSHSEKTNLVRPVSFALLWYSSAHAQNSGTVYKMCTPNCSKLHTQSRLKSCSRVASTHESCAQTLRSCAAQLLLEHLAGPALAALQPPLVLRLRGTRVAGAGGVSECERGREAR